MRLDNQLIMNTTPTKNLHQYSIETLESIKRQIDEMPDSKRIGVLGTDSDSVEISNMAFVYSNPRIIDDSLTLDIELLDTPAGQQLKAQLLLETDGICFRPAGQAEMPAETEMMKLLKVPVKIGADYVLHTIQTVNQSEDALQYPAPTAMSWQQVNITVDSPDSEKISKLVKKT